ncbi:MAG: GTP-binding protein, partial [Bacteroidales bacterium]|nr:GTP-binding protein [Bacteroidales bacterium]
MKEYSTKDIRNVVLLGSTKSGKTSLSEAILFEGKVIDRRGTVEDKNTVSDYTEIEKLNQRSIYGAPLYAEFEGKKINVIDAPGADDFCGGAFAAFKVCENGVLLVNAQQGVEVGTEIFARHAANAKLPLVLAINQLDSEKADWDNLQNSLKEAFGGKPVYVQFPVNPGTAFDAFVDVLTMKYYKFTDQNGKCTVSDIPAEFADQAETMHAELVEKAAEYDEELMMKFFDEGDLSEEEIIKGLSTGYANGD